MKIKKNRCNTLVHFPLKTDTFLSPFSIRFTRIINMKTISRFGTTMTPLLVLVFIFVIFYAIHWTLKRKRIYSWPSMEHFQGEGGGKLYDKINGDDLTKKGTSVIPKIIIQTWKSKSIPTKYIADVASLKAHNKDYQFLFFSDDDIEFFLGENYPEYLQTYQKLPVKIQKIDFFRYIAVYHYGGFYFDLDILGLAPLDELLDYECIFPIDMHITKNKCGKSRYRKYCKMGFDILLGQYAFAAAPKDPFVLLLIETIHTRIDEYIELFKTDGKSLQYVYSSTGPDFVTDVYLDYPNKSHIKILNHTEGQYFGKYAKHNYYGTWK